MNSWPEWGTVIFKKCFASIYGYRRDVVFLLQCPTLPVLVWFL